MSCGFEASEGQVCREKEKSSLSPPTFFSDFIHGLRSTPSIHGRVALIGSLNHPDFHLTSCLINESLLWIEGRKRKKKTSGIAEAGTHKNYTLISFLMDRKAKWIEHLTAYERVLARDRDTARKRKTACVCVVCVREVSQTSPLTWPGPLEPERNPANHKPSSSARVRVWVFSTYPLLLNGSQRANT